MFDYDATVIERLEAAGAILVAKLTMGELAMGDVWFGGTTRSPWNPVLGSSGSSAGPGSATAAGLVGFGIGTETLGSIVSPSVRNGVTGLRPTFGRVSRHGAMPLSWTMDKIGPMARGVEDCALILSAIHGADGHDITAIDAPFRWNPALPLKKLRVGVDQSAFDDMHKAATQADARPRAKERAAVYQNALDTIKGLGVTLVPVTLPANAELYNPIAGITIDVEGASSFATLTASGKLDTLAQQDDWNWPNTFRAGSTIPASDYIQAMRLRSKLQREMADALKDVDCFVTVPFHGPTLVYTNLTGHPTLVTRCGMLQGVPQSIEFVGNLYEEAAILRLGLAYEQATTVAQAVARRGQTARHAARHAQTAGMILMNQRRAYMSISMIGMPGLYCCAAIALGLLTIAAKPANADESGAAMQRAMAGGETLALWPGAAPGEKGGIGAEKDTSAPNPKETGDKYVIRLGNVTRPTLTIYRPAKTKTRARPSWSVPAAGTAFSPMTWRAARYAAG